MNKGMLCRWINCDRFFSTDVEVFQHVKLQHIGLKSTKCHWSGCKIRTSTKWNLVNHINIHVDINRGICHICDKSFRWKGDFRRHIAKHSKQNSHFNDAVILLFEG